MVPEKAMQKPNPQRRSQGVRNIRNIGHLPEKASDSGQSQQERGLWIATVDFPSGNECYCVLEERNFGLNLQGLTAKSVP